MENTDVPVRLRCYRLGKTLGIGSFGKVKLAEHEITGHKVAIKILSRSKIRNYDMSEKVRREISLLKMMRHPHIIRLYEVIDTPTDIFMVLEYVAGGELFDYIVSKGRLPPDEARRFFHQIISGVEYCHYHRIVHRDLKPENLLLDADNNIKIADFGLSNAMHDGDFLRTSCGSPNYAAPEVISGNLYAGPEVDIWSCGVILYALLCGTLPFDDESIPNLFKKIRGGMYSLPSHLSDLARDLIPRLLVVDPMKRISMADIRAHPWFQMGLPPYLQNPPEALERQIFDVDDDIVLQVSQLSIDGVSKQAVLQSINHRRMGDEICVAYDLLLDHKHAKIRVNELKNTKTQDKTPKAFSPPLAPPLLVPNSTPLLMSASPMIGPSPDKNHMISGPGASSLSLSNSAQLAAKRRRWYLGIQSKKEPAHVMTEVYKALHSLQFEWTVLGPYRIRCRRAMNNNSSPMIDNLLPPYHYQPASDSRKRSGIQAPIKLGLQLYKVQQHIYLLDFQKIEGDAFTYMNVCARIITELKILSGVHPSSAATDLRGNNAEYAGQLSRFGEMPSMGRRPPGVPRANNGGPVGASDMVNIDVNYQYNNGGRRYQTPAIPVARHEKRANYGVGGIPIPPNGEF